MLLPSGVILDLDKMSFTLLELSTWSSSYNHTRAQHPPNQLFSGPKELMSKWVYFMVIPSHSRELLCGWGLHTALLTTTHFSSVQFSSVAQSCPTLCDPMNHSMPGLPVHHQLLELNQTHVHRVSDAIQPSHPLSSPSPPAPNLSQHQSLFQWVNSLHEVAKIPT